MQADRWGLVRTGGSDDAKRKKPQEGGRWSRELQVGVPHVRRRKPTLGGLLITGSEWCTGERFGVRRLCPEHTPNHRRCLHGRFFRSIPMRYFSGVVSGVLLTILVVFLIDQVRPGPQIVNWNVLSTRIGEAKEEVRQDVHEATAPEGQSTSPAER